MTSKKFIVIFLLILLILSIFNFSSVHAENIYLTTSNIERMQADIDYLKQLLKNNNINNINDLASYVGVGANNVSMLQYIYIEDAAHIINNYQFAYFYSSTDGISMGENNYSYYGIEQNSFTLPFNYKLRWDVSGRNSSFPFSTKFFSIYFYCSLLLVSRKNC